MHPSNFDQPRPRETNRTEKVSPLVLSTRSVAGYRLIATCGGPLSRRVSARFYITVCVTKRKQNKKMKREKRLKALGLFVVVVVVVV